MFGGASVREELPIPSTQPWLPAERLQHGYDAIGFFLSGHPLDDYASALRQLKLSSYAMTCGRASSRPNRLSRRLRRCRRTCASSSARRRRSTASPNAWEPRGDGEVSMVLMLDAAEVEIGLPGRFKASPQVAGAIKAVPGVVQVEAI